MCETLVVACAFECLFAGRVNHRCVLPLNSSCTVLKNKIYLIHLSLTRGQRHAEPHTDGTSFLLRDQPDSHVIKSSLLVQPTQLWLPGRTQRGDKGSCGLIPTDRPSWCRGRKRTVCLPSPTNLHVTPGSGEKLATRTTLNQFQAQNLLE